MKSHSVDLTNGSITRDIILFSIPILLSNLFQQLYNSIDAMILGRFSGHLALAAVGSTGSLISLMTGFFLGIGTGTGILYAMYFGAGDKSGLKKLIDSAMLLSVITGIFITTVGLCFTDGLLSLLNTPEETFLMSKQYLVIYLYGTVVTMVYNTASGMIRAEGDSVRPLVYLLIGGVTNLVLDIVFVAVLGLGIKGAAWATVLAQAVTAVLVTVRITKLDPVYAFRPLSIRPDRIALQDIVRISVPCGLQSAMYNISNLLVQSGINSFGSTVMAGTAAYGKVDAFVYMPMNALGMAVSTYVGQNVGAGKYERIRKGIRSSLLISVVSSVTIMAVIFFNFDGLMHLFTDNEASISYGRLFMNYIFPVVWFYSVTDVVGGAIRGSGQATEITVILAITICAFRVIWLKTALPLYNQIGTVFICYPISWLLCGFTIIWYYFRRSNIYKTSRAKEKMMEAL